MKKQVLFVIDSLRCGGAEKSLVSLLPLLDYDRLDVDLLIVHRGGVFERYLPPNVRIIPLPVATGWRFFLQQLCRLRLTILLRIGRLVRKKWHSAELHWRVMGAAFAPMETRYDVAVAYHQGFPTYYTACKVTAAKKYAWINVDLLNAGYAEKFNRSFYDRFDAIAVVSETLRNLLEKTFYADQAKLCTVYDILNLNLIRQLAREPNFADHLPADVLRIATVGRLSVEKNHALALATAKILKENSLNFRWYFVGDGPERSNIERLVDIYGLHEHVVMLGMQPNPYPYMAGCDIYVQTSRFEGFCLTLREARILNKPVVTTNFSVAVDQIQDGENGLIAEMTAESLAEKILLLARNDALRKQLIAALRLEADRTMITETEKVNKMLLAG